MQGVASVRGSAQPVLREPRPGAEPVGELAPGRYAPFVRSQAEWLACRAPYVHLTLLDPRQVRLCIDPGHGGPEPGAMAHGLQEKEINLDVAFLYLGPMLLSDRRIDQVWYTRQEDADVELRYRADLATALGATLSVSIHHNAHPHPAIRSTQTYFKCGAARGRRRPAGRLPPARAHAAGHRRLGRA